MLTIPGETAQWERTMHWTEQDALDHLAAYVTHLADELHLNVYAEDLTEFDMHSLPHAEQFRRLQGCVMRGTFKIPRMERFVLRGKLLASEQERSYVRNVLHRRAQQLQGQIDGGFTEDEALWARVKIDTLNEAAHLFAEGTGAACRARKDKT